MDVAIVCSAHHAQPTSKENTKCIYCLISAKRTSFSTEIITFFWFSAVRKKAQNGTNDKKDTFFGLIFCFQRTDPSTNCFFAWSTLDAFGVILTIQLEPPNVEMAVDVYYVVAGIARHEYKQGWRFLTLWEGYGLSEATWEPMSAFIQPDGSIHPIFRSYLHRV